MGFLTCKSFHLLFDVLGHLATTYVHGVFRIAHRIVEGRIEYNLVGVCSIIAKSILSPFT
jgi:hypothetical protein